MKGIIIAGGKGTRLLPLTRVVNKSLLPIYDKPLIYYPIFKLKEAGITNILIIGGREKAGQFLDLMGSGKELGINLSYDVQEEPGGIAQALSIGEDFADNEKIIAILGDNVFEHNLIQAVENFEKQEKGAKVFLKEVTDPQRFGVPEIDGEKIINIIEKPKNPPTNYAVTGIYMYDSQVWELIKNLKPSDRGELEITDLNNEYIKQNNMSYEILKGEWIDAGTFEALLKANILIAKRKGII
ncbi:sugar phosphate nucleotidyltransferase [Patescibacteria group bacterium]